jgi:hypothetical protein
MLDAKPAVVLELKKAQNQKSVAPVRVKARYGLARAFFICNKPVRIAKAREKLSKIHVRAVMARGGYVSRAR